MSLRERINYGWRLAVTAFSFGAFGVFAVGGVLLNLLVTPFSFLIPDGRAGLRRRARWLIHKSFVILLSWLKATGTMRLEIRGAEDLCNRRGILVLANHPTFLDIVVLLSTIRDADCVVKSRHWRHLVLGGAVRAAGYIRNDSPEMLIERCTEALRKGGVLVIFPEGTRTSFSSRFHFRRGAAHIALRSGADIQPVILRCDPLTLTKNKKWYEVPERPFHFRMEIKPVTPLAQWIPDQEDSPLAARNLTRALEGFFTKEIYADGSHPA